MDKLQVIKLKYIKVKRINQLETEKIKLSVIFVYIDQKR